MATGFNPPSNPSIGDIYEYGQTRYVWNGYSWQVVSSPSEGSVPHGPQDDRPNSPTYGDLYYNVDTGQLEFYAETPDGPQWVEVQSSTVLPPLYGRGIPVDPMGVSNATEDSVGVSEIATTLEVSLGFDDFRYVTPAKLLGFISGGGIDAGDISLGVQINGNDNVQEALEDAVYDIKSLGNTINVIEVPYGRVNLEVTQSTESQLGGALIASQSQADGGIDDTTIITPLKLSSYFDNVGIDSDDININTPINGSRDLETILGDAIYNIGSQDGSVVVVETPDGQVDLSVDLTNVTIPSDNVIITNPINGSQDLETILGDAIYNIGSQDGSVTVTETPDGQADLSVDLTNVTIPSDNVTITNPINGSQDLETILGDAIYNIASADGSVTVTETPDGQVDLSVSTVPPATEGTQGSSEIATQAEADAGTDDFRYITPLKLHTVFGNQAINANDIAVVPSIGSQGTIQGAIEANRQFIGYLSTSSILLGTYDASTGLITGVTPAVGALGVGVGDPLPPAGIGPQGGYWIVSQPGATVPYIEVYNANAGAQTGDQLIDLGAQYALLPYSNEAVATEEVKGVAEIATQGETNIGLDDTKIVTPLKLSQYISNGGITSDQITLNPGFQGHLTVQEALEDAIYDIGSQDGSVVVTETPTGQVDLSVVLTNVNIPSDNIIITTPINGSQDLETILGDGIYNIGSQDGSIVVTETPTGQVDLALARVPKIHPPGSLVPTNPIPGDLWFNIDTGSLYTYYDDGDSSQWVNVNPPTYW